MKRRYWAQTSGLRLDRTQLTAQIAAVITTMMRPIRIAENTNPTTDFNTHNTIAIAMTLTNIDAKLGALVGREAIAVNPSR